jgi:hypothetical protein
MAFEACEGSNWYGALSFWRHECVFSILKYKQHVTVKHIIATRLLDIPRSKGHKSSRTSSLGCQSLLVYAALSLCVDCAAGSTDLRVPAFIVLLMVSLSSLRVVSSQFAEEGVYSQRRQHLGLILTNQLEELLFDFCPGKNTKPQCIMKLKRLI